MKSGNRHYLESKKYPSERIPKELIGIRCIIGIDEAGRGPVLGPLVYSLFISPEDDESWLKKNGANDSKLLTASSREAFFDILLANDAPVMGWRAGILHPEHISNCMLRRNKINLNELSYSTVYSLIESVLKDGVIITSAFVDTLGKAEKYEDTLTSKFPGIKFTVRSKADSLYPVVGAASIVAKVLRDDILHDGMGVKASGYPGDAGTVQWLRDNVHPVFGFPREVRFSWGSCSGFLEKDCVKVTWCDDEQVETIAVVKSVDRKRPFTKTNLFNPTNFIPTNLF